MKEELGHNCLVIFIREYAGGEPESGYGCGSGREWSTPSHSKSLHTYGVLRYRIFDLGLIT